MSQISIQGLDKADVLAALYNASKPQGMGFLQYDPKPMTKQEAEQLLQRTKYFDYLKGRVMKVSLEGNEFDGWLYDRDNGNDAANKVITLLRQSGNTNHDEIKNTHAKATVESAKNAKQQLGSETTLEGNVMTLGLGEVREVLEPMIDKAVADKGAHSY